MINVILFSRYNHQGASSRLRSYQYLPYLEKNNFKIEIAPLFNANYLNALYYGNSHNNVNIFFSYINRLFILFKLRKYDLIWIEKEIFPWLPAVAERILSALNIKYVVDFDDAIFHRYDNHKNIFIRKLLGKKIDTVMKCANTVIVGNQYLADRALKAGAKKVSIIPTVVDLLRYSERPKVNNSFFKIGWIGTPKTVHYLYDISPALLKISSKYNVKLVLIGVSTFDSDKLKVEFQSWSIDSEVNNLFQIDVGIMPLPEEPFARGKCGYKLIQYMACKKPVIASPVGFNKEIIKHGVNGYLATSQDDWFIYIEKMINNKNLMNTMGINGYNLIKKEYSLGVTAPKLLEILKSVHR